MISALAVLAAAMLVSASSNATASSTTASSSGEKLIGAGLASGWQPGGAGVGMGGTAGAAIVSASLEKRDMVMFLLVLAFVETIAIYGIVIAILIMSHP